MSIYEYLTIWVNNNPTHLLNGSRFLNPNITCLSNDSLALIRLSNFIKPKKIQILVLTKLILLGSKSLEQLANCEQKFV